MICVGNLTSGGTGKTPVAAAIAARLAARGLAPAILLRGYGGRKDRPAARRSAHLHTVDDVGDEALLHARAFPVWVAPERDRAAEAAIAGGATVLVMDDGHQHGRLAKDLSLVVVDGDRAVSAMAASCRRGLYARTSPPASPAPTRSSSWAMIPATSPPRLARTPADFARAL